MIRFSRVSPLVGAIVVTLCATVAIKDARPYETSAVSFESIWAALGQGAEIARMWVGF